MMLTLHYFKDRVSVPDTPQVQILFPKLLIVHTVYRLYTRLILLEARNLSDMVERPNKRQIKEPFHELQKSFDVLTIGGSGVHTPQNSLLRKRMVIDSIQYNLVKWQLIKGEIVVREKLVEEQDGELYVNLSV